MNKIKFQIVILLLSVCSISCAKNQTNKEKETKFTANAGSVKTNGGLNRVKLTFVIKDESIKKCEIFWNERAKSQSVVLANKTSDTIAAIINNLEEGNYTFEVVTYDEKNNSTAVKASGKSYGGKYAGGLKTREIKESTFITGEVPFIDWQIAQTGEVGVQVSYVDDADKQKKVTIRNYETKTNLPGHKPNTTITYKSAYLPEISALDTFYSETKTLVPGYYSADVSAIVKRSGLVSTVTGQSTLNLYEGVTYSSVNFKKSNGEPLSVFILKVDLNNKNITLSALMPNNQTVLGNQTVKGMAEARNSSGQKVLAAVNADFYEAGGRPLGPVFINGQAIKTVYKQADTYYFGVRKDDSPIIGVYSQLPATDYVNLRDAVGGGVNAVVTNGVGSTYGDTVKEPRTMIGYNGNVVYIGLVDGRKPATSVGATLDELGKIMKSLGCVQALNLDGGGSSTMVLKNIADDQFSIVNAYSDANPRAVANGLGIVIK